MANGDNNKFLSDLDEPLLVWSNGNHKFVSFFGATVAAAAADDADADDDDANDDCNADLDNDDNIVSNDASFRGYADDGDTPHPNS